MQFQRYSLDDSANATGLTIVIDVLRAFSSACYAFGAGADRILLVSEVTQAFALRDKFLGSLLMGEVGGGPIDGFDYSNSPAHYEPHSLNGRTLIQRTSNGTQGVLAANRAERILAASFVCAGATARTIRQANPAQVSFVITAWHAASNDPLYGDEDAACADYIEALLQGSDPNPAPYLARVSGSLTGQLFQSNTRPEYPATDLPYCLALDRFDFALPVEREAGGLVVLRPRRV